MLPPQVSRLLSSQAYSVLLQRQQHVPRIVPAMLRSCLFHLSRISACGITHAERLHSPCHSVATVTTSSSLYPQLCAVKKTGLFRSKLPHSSCHSVALARGFSTSFCLCAEKKAANSVAGPSPGVGRCQVFDQAELLVGQMTVKEAEELARKDNLKLLDMGVNADGLRSFRLISGKDLAEERKRLKAESKTKKVKEKEYRVTSNITDHDLDIRLRQVKDSLQKGAPVKITIKTRHKDQAEGDRKVAQLVRKLTRGLEELAVVKEGVRSQKEQQLVLRPKASSVQSSAEE